eukprot:TRINITY_DN575_c0_g1_i1.p1 TRINITY_DN575_c0_g1~~TRINITY_DN575_c0_g1_i1.p1  ORF type:complete len:194 (+),score=45.42 TRINITY_DN575_c0_g1_i1:67-648(+)
MDYYGHPYQGAYDCEYPVPPHCAYGVPPPHMMWGPPPMGGMMPPPPPPGMPLPSDPHAYGMPPAEPVPCANVDDGYDIWAAAIATATPEEEPKIVHAIVADKKKKKKKKKKSKKNKANRRGRSLERESVNSDGMTLSRSASCDIETGSLCDEFAPVQRRSSSLPPTETTCLEGSLRLGGYQIHPMRRGLSKLF